MGSYYSGRRYSPGAVPFGEPLEDRSRSRPWWQILWLWIGKCSSEDRSRGGREGDKEEGTNPFGVLKRTKRSTAGSTADVDGCAAVSRRQHGPLAEI